MIVNKRPPKRPAPRRRHPIGLSGTDRARSAAGNTDIGLALALVAATRGYGLGCVMPEKMSVDKRIVLATRPRVRAVLADPVGSTLADWVETGTRGADGSCAIEGIDASEAVENLHRDVLPDSWGRYRAKPWMQEWSS